MKGKRSSEEQLMRIWPEAEPLDNVREARRQHHMPNRHSDLEGTNAIG